MATERHEPVSPMTLIEIDALTHVYPGDITAVCNLSLQIPAGRRIALLGPNGSGKSTLLRHLNGLLRPTSGEIRFAGRPIRYDRHGLRALRQQVGLIFQEPEDQLFAATVAEDIAFGPLNLGLARGDVERRIAAAAAATEIGDLLDRPLHALSGGQKMRVAIAGVLAMEPTVILADEPTASLDPWLQRRLLDLFDRLVASGRTVLLATHDLDRAYTWADEVVVLCGGRLAASGPPQHVLSDPVLLEACAWQMPWPLALHQALGLPGSPPRTRAELLARLTSLSDSWFPRGDFEEDLARNGS